ncbi:uncharacterized protein LOC113389000 [Ctenocephalides felis]|uniref:uncharacterized protein LOC113389000 n=1 Tax=Ctenocephalides felis TaxID=7515 RepID=UPI000E6E3943|nr:uncharacterized protein LOC113389000 [Ctenocephalides felis]
MATYGTVQLILNFGLKRNFSWKFVIADVEKPIIGADFLSIYNLLVDLRNKRLLEGDTKAQMMGKVTDAVVPTVKTLRKEHHSLLQEFPDITRPQGAPHTVKHSTTHHINTTPGPPIYFKPRRLNAERLQIAKTEFEEMVQLGIARRSNSPWAAPLHMVPKRNLG